MDGNGRWAKARGLPRALGHREGVQALKRTIQAAPDLGIECLTVFGFSTENWSRPEDEVSDLMGLVRTYVASDLARLEKAGVRLRILGRREGLPADIAAIIDKAEAQTAHNARFLLQVAFNYGGRADLVDAARRHMARLASGETTEPLTERTFEAGLATAGSPPAGSDRADVRGAAAVELPVVGSRLRRTGVPGHPVARLRTQGPGRSGRRLWPARPTLRRSRRRVRARNSLMAVKARDIALRAASAVVLAPAAVAATWAGGVWFLALMVAASIVLAFEWAAMSAPHARRGDRRGRRFRRRGGRDQRPISA